MVEEEYLKDRLENQIDWYDRKSIHNQKWFKRLQVTSILAAASIPFLSGYITGTTLILKLATGSLGLLVAAITAVLSVYKFQENWLKYRTACESLKHEKYLYLTKSEPYDAAEPFKLLVQRVEAMISKENSEWTQYIKTSKRQEK